MSKQPITIFQSDKFVVTDHHEHGVEVQFRTVDVTGDTQGSKWFIDAAGDQVRGFFAGDNAHKSRVMAERLLERRLDIKAEPLRP